MAARKRAATKQRTFINQTSNGSAATRGNSQSPMTSTRTINGSDLTTRLRLFVLILLVLGLVGFLLYPDILRVLKTVHENAGVSEQTQKQEVQQEDVFIHQRDSTEQDESLTPFDEDDAIVPLDDETDHENGGLFEQTKKQEFKQEEKFIHEKNSVEQDENLVLFDEDDAVVLLDDRIDHEDLMEDEEKGKKLSSKRTQNLKTERRRDETNQKGNSQSQAEPAKKETKTTHKEVKISPADVHTKEDRTDRSQTVTGGKKTGPIILTAKNSHVVLDPAQIKIIDSSSDKKVEVKHGQSKEHQSASKTQTSQKNINKSNEKVKAEKQAKVNTGTKTHDKTVKKSSSETSKNENREKSTENADDVLEQAKKFNSTFQKTFTPKKIFADGRRIPPIELLHQKTSNSSVRVFLFNDFLSTQECEGLIKAHDSHVQALSKPPILCFDSIATLRRHISDVKQNITVTPRDFTKGTKCVNTSFSLQLQTWMNSNWSYSTAFYPGESTFSKVIAYRIKEAMGLDPASGGKFQITSYPEGKAYKEHTDCTLGGVDQRDRVVSVLMYLNNVEDGGETTFPHLGIWVKPKKGRALVWNNMSPAGACEEHSRHIASVVKKGSKYILIRWYYYKTFYSLGRRPPPPSLPEREHDQAMVTCDEYNSGSCRWYDEWSYDSQLEYEKNKHILI